MMAQRRSMHRRNPSVENPKYAPQGLVAPADMMPPTQHSQLAQISDYDFDNLGYTSDYPSQPMHPQKTVEEMNLSVLQRHYPEVVSVQSKAPYAAIYQFSATPEPAWAKTGIEGSFFICECTPGPLGEERYKAVVLNRKGLNNWVAPLINSDTGSVEINDQYVIVSFEEDGDPSVYGVYIFSEGPGTSTANMRDGNAEVMLRLAEAATISLRRAEYDATLPALPPATNGHGIGYAAADASRDHSNAAPLTGQQISLQQLFGHQNVQDSSQPQKHRDLDGAIEHLGATQYQSLANPAATQPTQHPQSDVIANLFRNAGIQMR